MDGLHDPGGKVRLPLPLYMRGGADFSPCGRYRTRLWRTWGDDAAPYALFIGMNPSVADAMTDDPTVRREIGFTQRWGLTSYVKTNVSAYRATDPKRLNGADIDCAANRDAILHAALDAEHTVLAFGTLKGEMRRLAAEIVSVLMAHEVPLRCLGTTADGSPRHPLYLCSNSLLVPWTGWRV